MKILCLSDYVDPLIYNQNIKQTFSDIDLIICAGDLPLDYIDFVVTMLNKPNYLFLAIITLTNFLTTTNRLPTLQILILSGITVITTVTAEPMRALR